MNKNGEQRGGCIGFLKSMQRITREIQPSGIYVVWEGGGSQRRRRIYSEYKLGRKAEKLNRFYGDDIPDSEENKKHQLISLLGMLKFVPVCQVYVSDCEGDDTVAHLCNGPFRNQDKIIVSSDKDMYQLLNDKTRIYSLHKKKIVTAEDIFDEFRIRTHNFAIAKAICGDSGDNVPGVKGIGEKGAALIATHFSTIDDAIGAAHENDERLPAALAKKIISGIDYLKIAPTVVNCARNVPLPGLEISLPKAPNDLSKIYQLKDQYALGASVDRLISALKW